MAKLVLNMEAVQDDFFADTVLLGIGSAAPGHRFCWAVNQYLGYNFTRTPDADILYTKKKKESLIINREYWFLDLLYDLDWHISLHPYQLYNPIVTLE